MSDGSGRASETSDSLGESTLRVLCVDDEPGVLDVTATFLERESDHVETIQATRPAAALDVLASGSIDCVVSDYQMPEMDGLALLDRVRAAYGDLPFVLFTGKGSEEIASEAISRQVTDYLQKGTGIDQYTVLANRIENAVVRHRAETRLDGVIESAPDGIVVFGVDGRIRQVNSRLETQFGYDRGELLGEDIELLVAESDRGDLDTFWEPYVELQTNQQVREGAITLHGQRRDGTQFPVEIGLSVVESDNSPEVVASVRDASERRRHQERLELAETLFENTQDALFLIDVDEDEDEYRLQRINPRYESHTGLSNSEIRGRTLRDVFGEEEGSAILERYRRCVARREPIEYEEQVSVPEQGTYWETRIAPVVIDDAVEQLVGATRDITDRRERERELTRQNERLEEFAAVVSHDLRNPLTVAQGSLELGRQSGKAADFDRVEAAHERMQALIEDLLALAREGRLVEETRPVALGPVVEAAWESVQVGRATLTVGVGAYRIDADEPRLRQLLENLLGNAVRHGGEDVGIRVGLLDDEDGFFVADDGPGIPSATRETVFDHGYSTNSAGTGFGLAIVEEIAEAHGWTVRATESTDGGARFEVTVVQPPRSADAERRQSTGE